MGMVATASRVSGSTFTKAPSHLGSRSTLGSPSAAYHMFFGPRIVLLQAYKVAGRPKG